MTFLRDMRWFAWAVLTLFSVIVGLAANFAIIAVMFNALVGNSSLQIMFGIAGIALTGALAGVGQALVLRDIFAAAPGQVPLIKGDWIVWTTLGVTLGTIIPGVVGFWAIPALLSGGFLSTAGTTVGGAILGVCQWAVLSRFVKRAALWVPVVALSGGIMQLIAQAGSIVSYLAGIIVGSIICGLFMTWLVALSTNHQKMTIAR
jgi:hypothetical protein